MLDIFRAYADAIHVATTLRPPIAPQHRLDNERFAEREAERRARAPLAVIEVARGCRALLHPVARLRSDTQPEYAYSDAGGMFWLWRNRFNGSYFLFSALSRRYFSGP